MWRLRRTQLLVAFGIVLCGPGCDPGRLGDPELALDPEPRRSSRPPTIPRTRADVLRMLVPYPASAVEVVLDVRGIGGLAGTLEVLAMAGGYRREHWRLTRPGTGDLTEAQVIEGTTTMTPDAITLGTPDGSLEQRDAELGALADAYRRAPASVQVQAHTQLQNWHVDLAHARAIQPGERERIAGIPCLRLRVADHTLCVWEETGIPLRHESQSWHAVARTVDLNPVGKTAVFEQATDARTNKANLEAADARMRALAQGDTRVLGTLRHPRLRIAEQAVTGE